MSTKTTKTAQATDLLHEARALLGFAYAAARGDKASAQEAFDQLDETFEQAVYDYAPAVYRWLDPENDRGNT